MEDELKMREEEERLDRAGIPDVDIYINLNREWYVFEASTNARLAELKPALPPLPEPIKAASYASLGSFIFASGGLLDVPVRTRTSLSDAFVYVPPRVNKEVTDWNALQSKKHFFLNLPSTGSKDSRDLVFPDSEVYGFCSLFNYRARAFPPVFYIDTLHPKEGWKAAAPMKANRYRHIMMVDAGKIYAFGGLNLLSHPPVSADGKYIFAEVYDLLNPDAGWKPLTSVNKDLINLPQHIDGHAVLEDALMERKILFHSYCHQNLYYLHIHRDEVGIYDSEFGKFHSPSICLGRAFFFLHPSNKLYAYDMSTSSTKASHVEILGLKDDTLPHIEVAGESRPSTILQSLGNGYLALIWMRSPEGVNFNCIHCSIIRMSRFRDTFVGKVVNYSFHIVKFGGWLTSCIVVQCNPYGRSTRWTPGEDVSLDAEHDKESDEQQQHKRKRDDEVGSSFSA